MSDSATGILHHPHSLEFPAGSRSQEQAEGQGERAAYQEPQSPSGVQTEESERYAAVCSVRCHAVCTEHLIPGRWPLAISIDMFAFCRYIRAIEVGREPTVQKYELHIRLRTKRDGPVIRNMLRFPHAVQTESRICVICPPGSKQAKEALAAGAVLVGEDEVFEAVKAGKIEFDRCLAHPDSLPALNKAALGRILGPRGLMPSAKTGTVVEDVAARVEMLRGGTVYRERDAVIRLPVGQLGFSPEQLRDNMRVTLDQIKKDASALTDRVNKEIYEVVCFSNHTFFSILCSNKRFRF